MRNRLFTIRARCLMVAGASLALAMATFAHAAATNVLVGGGSTLPVLGFVSGGNAAGGQIFPAAADSLFGLASVRFEVSYCVADDNDVQNIFDLQPGTSAAITCTPNSAGVTKGFGGAAVGEPDLAQPSYIVTDVPLSQTELASYTSTHDGNLPVQFPAAAGAIAIAMNMHTADGVVLNDTNTSFDDAQLCSIFSGAVINWNDPSLASAFTLGSNDSIPSTPIAVQYRSDSSGTTFSVSNYLTAVCSHTATQHFLASLSFTDMVYTYLLTLPANWTGSSGNAGVDKAIAATSGSIGYTEMSNSVNAGVGFAKVDGIDPNAFGSTKFAVTSSNLVYNEVLTSTDNTSTGAPTLAAISPAPATQCILTVTPSSYADPSGAYPIMAIVYVLGNSAGDPAADVADIRALLGAPYNSAVTNNSNLKGFGEGTGLSLLNVGTLITTSLVSSCVD